MSHRSLCESKPATLPWKLLNCLREVLFLSEIFKCAVLRVSSQSWKSSGNSWAMNPFCSNPVSEWRGDDDKHSNLNISCPAFPLAFSSMTVNCWLMRHQHCFVSIYPSMGVFWRQLTAWDGQLYVNQHRITENTTAECAGNCRNLHSRSQFLGSYKSGNSELRISPIIFTFNTKRWTWTKTSDPNAFKNTQVCI